jgi:hypothetical protein
MQLQRNYNAPTMLAWQLQCNYNATTMQLQCNHNAGLAIPLPLLKRNGCLHCIPLAPHRTYTPAFAPVSPATIPNAALLLPAPSKPVPHGI